MARYEFSTGGTFRNEVLHRQKNRCAVKGCSENESASVQRGVGAIRWAWEFHHVIPSQLGDCNRDKPEFLRFLTSADNCVAICSNCHWAVHDGGRWGKGAVAPADYYSYSHGGGGGHRTWANEIERWWSKISFPD